MTDQRFADWTFHALEFDDPDVWSRTRERLLRFVRSVEGQRYVAELAKPVVILGSRAVRERPRYLHLTDGALQVMRHLEMPFDIHTTAFYQELPGNQVVYFDSLA